VQSPKRHTTEIRVKKNLLPTLGKESMGVTSKAMSSFNKRSLGILFRKPTHIHIEEHFRASIFVSILSSRSYFKKEKWWKCF
jgi:hypothetical protein